MRAENGGEVFVYDGELGLDETGAFVVARGANVVLEVIGPGATARRDRPGPSQTAGGHGAVHVELRPADALRLARAARPARPPGWQGVAFAVSATCARRYCTRRLPAPTHPDRSDGLAALSTAVLGEIGMRAGLGRREHVFLTRVRPPRCCRYA